MGKGDVAAHLIQIVNEPNPIIVFKAQDTFLIPLPVEDVAELIVGPG